MAADGLIYCIPNNANVILQSDKRCINEQLIKKDEIDSINQSTNSY